MSGPGAKLGSDAHCLDATFKKGGSLALSTGSSSPQDSVIVNFNGLLLVVESNQGDLLLSQSLINILLHQRSL